jgi:hypothetical protein
MPQLPRDMCRQTRRPKAGEREKAIQWKFFRSGRRKGRPRQPILAPYTLRVNKKHALSCTLHIILCNLGAIPYRVTGLC